MKRIISVVITIIFIWLVYVCVEYFRCYIGGASPFMGYIETTEEYTKRGGLGFYYVEYSILDSEKKDGDVLKEFYFIKWPLSKEKVVIANE